MIQICQMLCSLLIGIGLYRWTAVYSTDIELGQKLKWGHVI